MGGGRKLSMPTFLTIIFTIDIKDKMKLIVSLNKDMKITKEGKNWKKLNQKKERQYS